MADTQQSLEELIADYSAAPEELRNAVASIPAEHHGTRTQGVPEAGAWSVRELVAHCADADLAMDHRLRRILAEDRPRLANWDEEAFINSLNYAQEDVTLGLEVIDLTHRRLLPLLRTLPDAALDRVGIHELRGPQTAREILGYAGFHLKHHAAFVGRKQQAMGW